MSPTANYQLELNLQFSKPTSVSDNDVTTSVPSSSTEADNNDHQQQHQHVQCGGQNNQHTALDTCPPLSVDSLSLAEEQVTELSSEDESSLTSATDGEESDLDDSSSCHSSEQCTYTEEDMESESDCSDQSDEDEEVERPSTANNNNNINLRQSSRYITTFCQSDDEDEEEEEEEDDEDEDDEYSDSNCSSDCSSDSDLSNLDDFIDLMPPTSFSINYSSPIRDLVNSTNNNNNSNRPHYYHESDDDDYYICSTRRANNSVQPQTKETDKVIHNALRYSMNNGLNTSAIPWWLNFEDENHIQAIFKEYAEFLQLENEIKRIKRAPKPFIGRIHRRVLQFSDNQPDFLTVDTVKLFRWDIQPLGRQLNPYKTQLLLTTWDKESGIPTHFKTIESLSMNSYWMEVSCTTKSVLQSSYIYCSPIFDRMDNYRYSVSDQKYPVDYLLPESESDHRLHPYKRHSPSLVLSSHIYSHSLISQDHFLLKDTSNDNS
ncbi:hypothetical protein SAMD00019534_073770 [Acytostelium subglobosum LB1]|uniref:hypothetical protein n=1 Tax=Acytostelium subglobosum LB1 TaxID=1410327 RepID=UPI000644BC24|nr:hypothetical protein SAMD00019534_073770 [Acytostelium subglobosum LB1]GAM24202.1 hypothetical protein SAMD00019534_073770 [Acytostelium subglobosum LB1]|eukprot:XP_012752528.1 hypothetical protein SAMD00019534_073770 [Acytostelium subglobosum LB1]